MKVLNFKLFGVLALAGTMFLGACSNDDDDNGEPQVTKPSIDLVGSGNYTANDATLNVGDTLRFKWNVQKGDNDLKRFSLVGGQQTGTLFDSSNLSDNNAERYSDEIAILMQQSGDHEYTFEAYDSEDNKKSKTLTITAEEVNQVQSYEQTLLAAPLGEEDSKTFYASSDNSTYTKNEADGDASIQGEIDFGYWWSQDNGAILVNTAEYPSAVYDLNWSNTSSTQFGMTSVTTDEFDGIDNSDQVIVEAAADLSSKNVTGLEKDDVVAFETDAGKKGLIKVNDIVEGAGNNGEITFQVKIQN